METKTQDLLFPTLEYMPGSSQTTAKGGMTQREWSQAMILQGLIVQERNLDPDAIEDLHSRASTIAQTLLQGNNNADAAAFPGPDIEGPEGMSTKQWHRGCFARALCARGEVDRQIAPQATRLADAMVKISVRQRAEKT